MTTPAPHEHDDECRALFAEWHRYHAVAADEDGRFEAADRQTAAHQRDMFGRQLAAIGCDPWALLDAWEHEADVEDER